MNKIPCEVVRDLMPSYIDELTSDVSSRLIEEHVAECEECRNILEAMKPEPQESGQEQKDPEKNIDFLKKNRRRNRCILLSSIAAVLVICAVLFYARYLKGELTSDYSGDFFMWDVAVDGNRVVVDGRVVDNIYKITGFEYAEHDGVVDIDASVVPSGFVAGILYGREYHTEYTAKEPVRQVWVAGRILWNEGEPVSAKASGIYLSHHPYIGDASANAFTANSLNIYNYFGPFMNELSTQKQPYEWKVILTQDIPADKCAEKEKEMESFSYLMLAVVENMDQAAWQYRTDGKEVVKTVTAQEASAFFGQDIKNCYEDVSLLDELIRKTGLDRYAFGGVPFESSAAPENGTTRFSCIIPVVNNSEEGIKEVMISYYVDGELRETQGGVNADESLIRKGQLIQLWLEQEELAGQFVSEREVEFSLTNLQGEQMEIPGRIRIPSVNNYYSLHDLHLTGNSQDGFQISQ